jgi:hypothetical protein
MAEQPALNRFYVASYAANDKDFPILAVRLDPRVAGYRVPEDLSPHPDSKRYPNHVFTGSQPSNGDERVTHIYEILPSPYVPFTRYDDDLGPIQGRRRSVKNEGQEASLASDKKVSYEGREGSAIVSNEIEETWSIKVDEDGNSLFPIKDRDFYDPSRGAVQERRQLFVPTGEEEGTLENVNGVITQTSYEPYNEFLSVKIIQTYKVDGPQLVGRATDNDGQLVTVTTQRKGSLNYIPPSPTATRTVEVNREDAESLVERIVDTPEIFTAQTFQVERPDPIPQKFRVAVPLQSSQEVVAGQAELPELSEGEISRAEQQQNKFLKRVSATSRDQTVLPQTLIQKATDNDRQEVTITETLQLGDTDEVATATTTVESEALGDGNYVIRKTAVPKVFAGEAYSKTKEDLTPQKFRGAQEDTTFEQTIAGIAAPPSLGSGEFAKSEQQVNNFVKRVSTTSRAITEAVTLVERVLTQEGQIATRTLTLSSGDQFFVPSSLLIDANVEALGDGRTVKTETRVPTVFAGRSIQKSRVDLTPQKFRAAQEDTTAEETIAGTINPNIALGAGEFAKSEQQITQFVKRVSTNTRDISASTDLSEIVITPQGQVATRTLRLSAEAQSIQPDALLVDGSIEALGDGRTIKTETRVPNVFSEKVFSIERPDNVPQKFKAKIPVLTTQESISGIASTPSLSVGQFAKSEQQVTEFVKRTSITSRDTSQAAVLTGVQYTPELGGGMAVVIETYPFSGSSPTVPDFGVISDEVEDLGDGTKVRRQVKLLPQNYSLDFFDDDNNPVFSQSLQPLRGQDYDEELDIVIPYQQVVAQPSSTTITEGSRRRVNPRDISHSIVQKYDVEDIQQSLDDYYWEIPDMIEISLPDKLKRVVLLVGSAGSSGSGSGAGNTYSYSFERRGSVSGSISYDIEQGFRGTIPTIRAIFFLPKESASPNDVLNKINQNRSGVDFWPNVKPESHFVTITEGSFFQEQSFSVSFDSSSESSSSGGSYEKEAFIIPPTIHDKIEITGPGGRFVEGQGIVNVNPNVLEKTKFAEFPSGEFLYRINATPYKFSYVRVDALIVEITNEYV